MADDDQGRTRHGQVQDPTMAAPPVHLGLVAETDQRSLGEGHGLHSYTHTSPCPAPFFTSTQWTADGTTAVVVSSDQTVRAFVLPDDLLEDAGGEARGLAPQASTKLSEPTQVVVPAPYFSLQDPANQTFLTACRDQPIQLRHVFPDPARPTPLATYKLVKKETEEFISPSSLLWQYPGTHFLCGSTNRLDLFDASGHASAGPVVTVPTTPSRRHISQESGVGMKGIVSALSGSLPEAGSGSITAAGTWTRMVGLYDLHRTDKTISNWSVSQAAELTTGKDLGGRGVAQTLWSPCGRYLVVNERRASGLLVYDIRVTGQLLSILRGRETATQQRMHGDVFPGADGGFEVWAGSQDGRVRVWQDVGLHGDVDAQPRWDWKAHDAPVGSSVLHPSGSVIATCSGGWEHARRFDDDEELPSTVDATGRAGTAVLYESSFRLWSIDMASGGSPGATSIPIRTAPFS